MQNALLDTVLDAEKTINVLSFLFSSKLKYNSVALEEPEIIQISLLVPTFCLWSGDNSAI